MWLDFVLSLIRNSHLFVDSFLFFFTLRILPSFLSLLCCNFTDFSGCRVEHFAQFYAKKVGVSASVLQQTLWGDYYLDSKTKTVKKGAQVSFLYC